LAEVCPVPVELRQLRERLALGRDLVEGHDAGEPLAKPLDDADARGLLLDHDLVGVAPERPLLNALELGLALGHGPDPPHLVDLTEPRLARDRDDAPDGLLAPVAVGDEV